MYCGLSQFEIVKDSGFCFYFILCLFVCFAHEHTQAVAHGAHWSMAGVFSSVSLILGCSFVLGLGFGFEAGSLAEPGAYRFS